jgi:hypothetical protein
MLGNLAAPAAWWRARAVDVLVKPRHVQFEFR